MRKDIEHREVLDLGIALVRDDSDASRPLWDVYLVNLKKDPIRNVIVNVEGSGIVDEKKRTTSTVRYLFPEIPGESSQHVEVLMPDVSQLTQRYWVSFSHSNYLFDKKFFVQKDDLPDEPDFLIPLMNKLGVWIE